MRYLAAERVVEDNSIASRTVNNINNGSAEHSELSTNSDDLKEDSTGGLSFANNNSYSFNPAGSSLSQTADVDRSNETSTFNPNNGIGVSFLIPNKKQNRTTPSFNESRIRNNTKTKSNNGTPNHTTSGSQGMDISVNDLLTQIQREGQDVVWLQKQLLAACQVKYCQLNKSNGRNNEETVGSHSLLKLDPIAYHYSGIIVKKSTCFY